MNRRFQRYAPWLGAAVFIAGLLAEAAIAVSAAPGGEKVVAISAMRFQYIPSTVKLKKGEPVILELSTLDRRHGFSIPEFGIHADIMPDETVQVRIVPDHTGTFNFHCDNFCGDDHESMEANIVVTE